MPDGWINLIAFGAVILIVASAIAIFTIAATRKGGRPKTGGVAKPGKSHYRQINPKTGDRFP